MRGSHSYLSRAATGAAWLLTLGLVGCGNPGETSTVACNLCGTMNDLTGSVSTRTGSQSQMKGWVVAAFEYDTGIARVGEVDDAGLYTLGQVRTDHAQTLALLTPDYILQAVTSVPGPVDKTIEQFVYFQAPQVPQLINDGPIITFTALTGLGENAKLASAQTGNGIPDGYTQIAGQSLTALGLDTPAGSPAFHPAHKDRHVTAERLAWLRDVQGQFPDKRQGAMLLDDSIDTNHDGVANVKDPDIDGDGIINWLDDDDNGNNILDIFDPDQNSDLVNDMTPEGHTTDQWFQEGLEYIAVQYELVPNATGSGNQAYLKFNAKVRTDTTPNAVQVRGAPSLLNGATYTAHDSQGNPSVQAWNRLLNDDGISEDGASGDRIFGQKVLLQAGKVPRPNEVVFIELVFGTASAPYYIDYPWTFPDVVPAAITAQYQANTKTVSLVGSPFGTVTDFVWAITVIDSTGTAVWSSTSIPGSTRQFKIQSNIFVTGQTYKFSASAQSLDKVPGVPAYIINTPLYPMQ